MKNIDLTLMYASIGVLLLTIAAATHAGQVKVDVCHITGTFDFGGGDVPVGHVIRIADPAYLSHINHGDPETWAIIGDYCTAEVVAPEQMWVFVTSGTYLGQDLGGVSGADEICQAHADTATPPLPGTYKAWISNGTFSSGVSSSPDTTFTRSTVPYQLVNGDIVANNWTDLVDGKLIVPIGLDEDGNVVTNTTEVWTNTDEYGSLIDVNKDCGEWNGDYDIDLWKDSMAGSTNSEYFYWTVDIQKYCHVDQARLYCFQQ